MRDYPGDGYGYGMHGGGGALWIMVAIVLIVVVLLVTVLYLLLAQTSSGSGSRTGRQAETDEAPRPSADRLLAERFARGEVDEDEFLRRRAVLHGG